MPAPFRFQVFPTSGLPIYRQIVDQVRHQIAAGRLAPGEFLPSVRQTALDVQVNPMTVSKAYSLLEREGLLELVRGQGMRIASKAQPSVAGSSGSGAAKPVETIRQRRQHLLPLLKQVVATAYHLGLTAEQVHDMLDPLLQEVERHEPAHDRAR